MHFLFKGGCFWFTAMMKNISAIHRQGLYYFFIPAKKKEQVYGWDELTSIKNMNIDLLLATLTT